MCDGPGGGESITSGRADVDLPRVLKHQRTRDAVRDLQAECRDTWLPGGEIHRVLRAGLEHVRVALRECAHVDDLRVVGVEVEREVALVRDGAAVLREDPHGKRQARNAASELQGPCSASLE